jgi:hypothetical protein
VPSALLAQVEAPGRVATVCVSFLFSLILLWLPTVEFKCSFVLILLAPLCEVEG